jgi:excisionase family DNA binding protein
MEKAFYRISEVAEVIGLGKSLTYKLVAEGRIPSVWLAGCRSRRISKVALEKWISEQTDVVREEG